jgi:hypothetical protein
VKENLIKKLAVTFELCGGVVLSEGAMLQIVDDLEAYPEAALSAALDRCRAEVRGRLTPADITQRIDDGRPGPEQAWALLPKDEDCSVCWTDEMRVAFGVCCSLIGSDMVAARMAFLEAYRGEVQKAKSQGTPVNWQISLGHRKSEREDCIRNAMLDGKITQEHALSMCPDIKIPNMLPDRSDVMQLVDSLSKKMTI